MPKNQKKTGWLGASKGFQVQWAFQGRGSPAVSGARRSPKASLQGFSGQPIQRRPKPSGTCQEDLSSLTASQTGTSTTSPGPLPRAALQALTSIGEIRCSEFWVSDLLHVRSRQCHSSFMTNILNGDFKAMFNVQLGVDVNKVETGHDGNSASRFLGSSGFQGPKSKNKSVQAKVKRCCCC